MFSFFSKAPIDPNNISESSSDDEADQTGRVKNAGNNDPRLLSGPPNQGQSTSAPNSNFSASKRGADESTTQVVLGAQEAQVVDQLTPLASNTLERSEDESTNLDGEAKQVYSSSTTPKGNVASFFPYQHAEGEIPNNSEFESAKFHRDRSKEQPKTSSVDESTENSPLAENLTVDRNVSDPQLKTGDYATLPSHSGSTEEFPVKDDAKPATPIKNQSNAIYVISAVAAATALFAGVVYYFYDSISGLIFPDKAIPGIADEIVLEPKIDQNYEVDDIIDCSNNHISEELIERESIVLTGDANL
ncbi:MAG: hypothetical protein SFT93_01255 [Rickettsiaceae bacterium]|nr:hypothetical protein [Rickettsiaceae bacterium]